MLKINPKTETEKIIKFIKKTLRDQGFKKVVLGLSGGIDSSTCLILLRKTLKPNNINVLLLPYGNKNLNLGKLVLAQANIPIKNIKVINIKPLVDQFKIKNKLRKANLMARIRMILLYNQAKKEKALVCGTENKSEHVLGYYTRFGDQASDLEPIIHLYKTQVYKLAKYLKIPSPIINKPPSADLWLGQTDKKELGFTYLEADPVLYLYLNRKLKGKEIKKKGYKKVEKIVKRVKTNQFKEKTPYSLK